MTRVGVQIKKVEINSCGPILRFSEELSPLTLLYGKNESGKTTFLDAVVTSLFKKRSRVRSLLRSSSVVSGGVLVSLSGLDDGLVPFMPGGESLDQYLSEKGFSIPDCLYPLLFVRAADATISGTKEKVDRHTVRDLFSAVNSLSSLQFPNEVDYTRIEQGEVVGKRMGGVKRYEEYREALEELHALGQEFRARLVDRGMVSLRKEILQLQSEKEEQLQASRYYACRLDRQLKKQRERLSVLQSVLVTKADEDYRLFIDLGEKAKEFTAVLAESNSVEKELVWLDAAREQFHGFNREGAASFDYLLFSVLFSVAGGLVLSFLDSPVRFVFFGVALLLGLVRLLVKGAASTLGSGTEQQRALVAQFKEKFGQPLRTLADFESVRTTLLERLGERKGVQREFAKIKQQSDGASSRLRAFFRNCFTTMVAEEEWGFLLRQLKEEYTSLNTEIARGEEQLKALAVDPDDYLEEWGGPRFSSRKLRVIEEKLFKLGEQLELAERSMRSLREQLGAYIGITVDYSSNELLEKIEDRIYQYEQAIEDELAPIIAGHLIKDAITTYIEEEDRLLEKHLNSQLVGELLFSLTGRYERLYFDGDEIVAAGKEGAFKLRELSSGTQEQVLLALRVGIAEKITGKHGLFMVLDDAFQFADWERREQLVASVIDMVARGWQVLYLTMDDDIRDRFVQHGKKMDKNLFKLIEMG